MKICVYGTWHLGSVISACMADCGFDVCGTDPDTGIVAGLNKGKAPLFEPGLDDLLAKGLSSGKLSFNADLRKAVAGADVLWIAFDTPVDDNDNADIEFVAARTQDAMQYLGRGGKVIVSSQAPVGFIRSLEQYSAKTFPGKGLRFAVSPENLRLGKAIAVFSNPDRIVIGVRTPSDIKEFEPLFSRISPKLEWMRTESAEMTKHAINTFLAMSVVFANEIAGVCEAVGADAAEVARGLKTEERIGPKAYVGPGTAFAGGTLARDVNFLIKTGGALSRNVALFKAIRESNDMHKHWLHDKLKAVLGASLKGRRISVLGLTYKPGTSTLRRSLSVELCKWLIGEGALVSAFDPFAEPLPTTLASSVKVVSSFEDVLSATDCVVLGTEHKDFQVLVGSALETLKGKAVIDPSGFLGKTLSAAPGVRYFRVGKGNSYEA